MLPRLPVMLISSYLVLLEIPRGGSSEDRCQRVPPDDHPIPAAWAAAPYKANGASDMSARSQSSLVTGSLIALAMD